MPHLRILLLLIVTLLLARVGLFAQGAPEQDCFGALPVCSTVFQQGNSYTDFGAVQELFGLYPSSCLLNGENNSVWYIFNISADGDLEFAITPLSPTDDYDFSLFDITGQSCQDIVDGNIGEVRCSYALTNGIPTGLAAGNLLTRAGPNDPPFLAPLPVTVGQTFALMIDNFSSNGLGYSINFTGGAGVADTLSPYVDSIAAWGCDTTRFIDVFFSEPIDCSTLLANGSQFEITGPQTVNVIGSVGIDCGGMQTFTTAVRLRIASPILVGGTYYFDAIPGTGGVNILDVCGRAAIRDSASINAFSIVLPRFTYGISASCFVDTLLFINTSVPNTTNGNPIWSWDFGDSTNVSTLQDPAHVFPDTTNYRVRLTATTVDGCTYTSDSIVPVDRSYRAEFTFAPAEICPNVPVQFTDGSPGSAETWVWEFGDGNISGDENPVNTYTDPGTYTVTLTISENSGGSPCSATTSQDILVLPDVQGAFEINATQICEGSPVVFTDQTTGFPSAWLWDFGNGDTSIIQSPVYTFDSAGVFTITLTVSNACNMEVITRSFPVYDIPVFNLGSDTAICFDRSVTLYGFPGATMTWSTGQTGDSIEVVGAPIEVRGTATNNGCTYDDAIFIEELQEECIIVPVPSAFTPNNDGLNDVWRLVNPQRLLSIEVWIYNRWGELVFYDNQLNFAWNGLHKNEPAEMGVYSYVLRGFGESSRGREPVYYRGNLTLVR